MIDSYCKNISKITPFLSFVINWNSGCTKWLNKVNNFV